MTPIQIITLIVGGNILFVGIWSLTGLGSRRKREAAHGAQQRRGEVRGVVWSNHGKARNAATAK